MANIYREVYGDKHHYIDVGLSNLGSVYLERKQYVRAEKLLREVVQRYTQALSADHPDTGIARIKLGRALARQHRYAKAEVESLGGYSILVKQTSPTVSWLQIARQDLVAEYDALKQPQKAAKFRAELAAVGDKVSDVASRK